MLCEMMYGYLYIGVKKGWPLPDERDDEIYFMDWSVDLDKWTRYPGTFRPKLKCTLT